MREHFEGVRSEEWARTAFWGGQEEYPVVSDLMFPCGAGADTQSHSVRVDTFRFYSSG